MENENLLKKIASSFASTTNVDYQDLFQEASLAYFEALRTHDPSRAVLSTHVWHCVSNRLKNYVKKENIDVVFVDDYEQSVTVTPFWEQLSKDAMTVAEIVLDSPMEFLRLGKTHAPKKIKEILMEEGWDKKKIQRSLTELHIAFS